MPTLRKKSGAFLCLSAAFLALLAPMAFLLHAGSCGAHSPLCAAGVSGCADGECPAGYSHAHCGGAHDPNACLTCQALLQYISGVTTGFAHAVSVPADFEIRGCVAAANPSGGQRFSPFLSRAPPPMPCSVHS